METFDEVLVEHSKRFMDKAKTDGKPFFIWHNTTRMHIFTFIPPKYQAMMNYWSNYGLEEAGMAQLDDSVGELLKHLKDIGEADNTIVIFTTDNGAEVFTWPDGGMTPFRATKGTSSICCWARALRRATRSFTSRAPSWVRSGSTISSSSSFSSLMDGPARR
jgi:arylsulfatase